MNGNDGVHSDLLKARCSALQCRL